MVLGEAPHNPLGLVPEVATIIAYRFLDDALKQYVQYA